jgi:hypothetical protein
MDDMFVANVHSKVFNENVFLELKLRCPIQRWWTSLQLNLTFDVSRIQGYNSSIDNHKDGYLFLDPQSRDMSYALKICVILSNKCHKVKIPCEFFESYLFEPPNLMVVMPNALQIVDFSSI